MIYKRLQLTFYGNYTLVWEHPLGLFLDWPIRATKSIGKRQDDDDVEGHSKIGEVICKSVCLLSVWQFDNLVLTLNNFFGEKNN